LGIKEKTGERGPKIIPKPRRNSRLRKGSRGVSGISEDFVW